MSSGKRLNLDNPRYDQKTFEGRAKHFFSTTNPLNVLASDEALEKAKGIVEAYRNGTEDKSLTEDQIWVGVLVHDNWQLCVVSLNLFYSLSVALTTQKSHENIFILFNYFNSSYC